MLLSPRYAFDSLASTNSKAWELIDQGIKPPFYVISPQQTAGRGQWGRNWQSSPGGLYLTWAIAFERPLSSAPHLTLFTAWGIADRLRDQHLPVALKWLNDLILDKRKLGGIKTEIRSQKGQITYAIVGVGVNVSNPVPEPGISLDHYQSTSKCPIDLSLSEVEQWVIQGMNRGYQRYLTVGIEEIIRDYEEMLVNRGQSIVFAGQTGCITGVTAQGELRVRLRSPGASTEICLPHGSVQLGYE